MAGHGNDDLVIYGYSRSAMVANQAVNMFSDRMKKALRGGKGDDHDDGDHTVAVAVRYVR